MQVKIKRLLLTVLTMVIFTAGISYSVNKEIPLFASESKAVGSLIKSPSPVCAESAVLTYGRGVCDFSFLQTASKTNHIQIRFVSKNMSAETSLPGVTVWLFVAEAVILFYGLFIKPEGFSVISYIHDRDGSKSNH